MCWVGVFHVKMLCQVWVTSRSQYTPSMLCERILWWLMGFHFCFFFNKYSFSCIQEDSTARQYIDGRISIDWLFFLQWFLSIASNYSVSLSENFTSPFTEGETAAFIVVSSRSSKFSFVRRYTYWNRVSFPFISIRIRIYVFFPLSGAHKRIFQYAFSAASVKQLHSATEQNWLTFVFYATQNRCGWRR